MPQQPDANLNDSRWLSADAYINPKQSAEVAAEKKKSILPGELLFAEGKLHAHQYRCI